MVELPGARVAALDPQFRPDVASRPERMFRGFDQAPAEPEGPQRRETRTAQEQARLPLARTRKVDPACPAGNVHIQGPDMTLFARVWAANAS